MARPKFNEYGTQTLLGSDHNRTALNGTAGIFAAYTPFGHRTGRAPVVGFNGESLEAGVDNYLLGHGYRAYSPSLLRFQKADDTSPFGKGGLNSYAYCGAEPVNRTDPTGYGPFVGVFGMIAGALIIGWGGIERATESGDHTKSNTLFGIGGGIMAVSLFGIGAGMLRTRSRSRAPSTVEIKLNEIVRNSNGEIERVTNTYVTTGAFAKKLRQLQKAAIRRQRARRFHWQD